MQRAKDRFASDRRTHEEARRSTHGGSWAGEPIDRAPDGDHAFRAVPLPNPFDDLFDPID